MTAKRKIEVFSAGCPVCEETIAMINRLACGSCEVSVLDMRKADVAARAGKLGVRSVPAVGDRRQTGRLLRGPRSGRGHPAGSRARPARLAIASLEQRNRHLHRCTKCSRLRVRKWSDRTE